MKKIMLYSRSECPLCEYAESLLIEYGVDYTIIDIDQDEQLIPKYHVRIPVISNGMNELDWPFSKDQITELYQ